MQKKMKYSLTSDFKRISFHDSKIERITRQNNSIEVTFDWAKISNYDESKESNGIIISKCKFTLMDVTEEKD